MQPILEKFLPVIETLPSNRPLTREDLITENLFMEKDNNLEMYFAPHNEYLNKHAKVIIVGITPGWSQMKTAYEQFVKSMRTEDSMKTALFATKYAARFAGSMRTNLVRMLNQCGIPQAIGLDDASELFNPSKNILHTTSVIKYPVFVKGKNYSGHQPAIKRSTLLQRYVYEEFPKEIAQISAPALIIPLGKAVEQAVIELAEADKLHGHTYLTGFPHPSGVNAHREGQFQREKASLRQQVKQWEIESIRSS